MAMVLFDEGKRRRMRDAVAKGETLVFQKGRGMAERPMPGPACTISPEERALWDYMLLAAVGGGNFNIAKDVLDKGADPNARDAAGTPAIMLAEKEYSERSEWAGNYSLKDMRRVDDTRNLDGINKTAELLLARGADPYATDARGLTVFDLSKVYRMPCITKLAGNMAMNAAMKAGKPSG